MIEPVFLLLVVIIMGRWHEYWYLVLANLFVVKSLREPLRRKQFLASAVASVEEYGLHTYTCALNIVADCHWVWLELYFITTGQNQDVSKVKNVAFLGSKQNHRRKLVEHNNGGIKIIYQRWLFCYCAADLKISLFTLTEAVIGQSYWLNTFFSLSVWINS